MKERIFVFYNSEIRRFADTAFRDFEAAKKYHKTLPRGKFALMTSGESFTQSDVKAYYAVWSDCKRLEDDKEEFGVSRTIHLYPDKNTMIYKDPMFNNIDPKSVIACNEDETCVSFVEYDGTICNYKILSIDII